MTKESEKNLLNIHKDIISELFDKDLSIRLRNNCYECSFSFKELSQYLNNHPLPRDSLTLETVPQLLAIVPINNLIYFNQHNNHPAAIFSKRYNYVQDLATAKSPVELIQKINNCPFGPLERFIFYGDQENYYLYFHVDKFISGLEEKTIKFNRQLFVPPYFQVNYNNLGYYVIDVQK